MLVSIVIPCYNLGRYLPDCIASITKQQLSTTEWEVIIVDDCSTDNSYLIAQDIGEFNGLHSYTKQVIQTPTNLYLSGALNYGIERARGKYILPLDADNMLGSDRSLEILVDALERDASLDIVYGGLELLEENGRLWASTWPPKEFSVETQFSGKDQIPSTSMYRKKVWQRIGGYRRYPRTAEDALFYTQAVALGCGVRKVTDATTLIYRNRRNSMSHIEKPWHWEQCAPSKPLWTPTTHEPVELCVVVVGNSDPWRTFDSLWAQNFDRWECYYILGEESASDDSVEPRGTNSDVEYPVWVESHNSTEMAVKDSSARLELILEAGAYFDHRDALGEMVKGGELMACGSCGQRRSGMVGSPLPRLSGGPRVGRGVGAERIEEPTQLVEYTGGGGQTIRGFNTKTTYYFKSSPSHRIKRVYNSDVEMLLRNVQFKLADEQEMETPTTLTHEVETDGELVGSGAGV